MTRFRVAEVAIEVDEKGVPKAYWIYRAGSQVQEFGYGSEGFKSLEGAIDTLKMRLLKDQDYLLNIIKTKLEDEKK